MATEQVKGVHITATTVKQLKATIDELRGSLIQLSKADSEYDTKVQALQAHQAKLNEVMSLTSKATMAQVKAIGAVENSYDALVAKGAKLREQWRTLEIGTAEWQKLATAINENEEQLKYADAQIGRYQRNVGNYVGAVAPLQYQIQQIAREMPSLTVSANQFFLAISNNLPMFADEISKLRKANEDLAAQGKPTVNILSQIVKGVFSWQTALVVLITLITQFGGKVIEWIKTLGKAKVSIDDLIKSVNNFATSIETERRELGSLFNTLKNAENGTFAYANARKQITDKYGKYLENQSTEIRYLSDLAGAYEVLKGKIEAVSITKALESQRTEAIKEYQNAIDEAFNGQITRQAVRTFGEQYGLELIARIRAGITSGVPELEAEAKNLANLLLPADGNTTEAITRVYKALDGKQIIGTVGAFYDMDDALEDVAEASDKFNIKLRSINATATQMATILGVTANDVEEVRKTIVDTSSVVVTANANTAEAERIAKATAQAERELRNEYKATQSELAEFAKGYLQTKQQERNEVQANIRELKAEEAEQLRYVEIANQTERQKAESRYNIQQQALINELALLQEGLDNEVFIGEERVRVQERMAQIEKDITYNTEKYKTEERKKSLTQYIQVATAGAGAISSILGSIADMYEQDAEKNAESAKKAKNIRIASATMDMLGGITTALAGAFTTKTGPWDLVLAGIQAASILASGIANISKIKNTDITGNSSGGGASGTTTSAVVSAPAIVQQVPITRTLTGVAEEERLNQAQKVYVVYDDIAQVGRKVEVVENEATF